MFEKLKQAGFEVVDMTCLDVKKVQQRAIELAKEDYFVIIVGNQKLRVISSGKTRRVCRWKKQ